MRIFEIFLNPEIKEGVVFKTFFYEPESIYEKRRGNLYMVGHLGKALPRNLRLLDNLSQVIKTRFYTLGKESAERALKESLKKANEFLEKLVKEGNVSWVPHLDFVILNFKDFEINLTKVGDFQILISREGKISEPSKNLQPHELEPYPLEVFGNIVSGTLAPGDRIVVLSSGISDFFEKKDLIEEITAPSVLDINHLKNVLEPRSQELMKLSGVCALGIFTLAEEEGKEVGERLILEKKENFFTKIKEVSQGISLPRVSLPRITLSLPRVSLPLDLKNRLPSLPRPLKKDKVTRALSPLQERIKKAFAFLQPNAILIGALILVTAIGVFVLRYERAYRTKTLQESLDKIEEKVHQAQALLIIKDEKGARSLLKEAWVEIRPLETSEPSFEKEVLPLREFIENKLLELSKLEDIEEPESIFEIDKKDFIPQKMILRGKSLYFFNPFSPNLFKLERQEGSLLPTDLKPKEATLLEESIIFLLKPNQTVSLENDQLGSVFNLESPSSEFSFDLMSSFGKNLYFLSKKTGEIAKYSKSPDNQWSGPQDWLKNKTSQSPFAAKSMAIDGSIWILKDNSLHRYSRGKLQQSITLDIFPPPKNFSKIWTSPTLSYLYVLESEQQRVIVLQKTGEIVRQFRSKAFKNLKDLAVSEGDEIIYLLNGQKIYTLSVK